MNLFFPDNKLSKRYKALEEDIALYANIIQRGEAVTEAVSASFEYQMAVLLTSTGLEDIVRALLTALKAFAEQLWPDGKRKSWWKWVMAIPEIAVFLISMFKALNNQPAK